MKRAAIAAPLLLTLICARGPVAYAQTPVTLDGYVDRLRAALESLRAADEDPGTSTARALASLGLPVTVRLPDGSSVLVTVETLLGTAAEGADSASAVTTRLRLALDAARDASTTPSPDRARIDEALSEAYGGTQPGSGSWVERVLSGLRQAIGWLLGHALEAIGRSGAGAALAWAVVLGLIVGALVLTQRVRHGVVADARWVSGSAEAALVDWRRIADEALAAGDLTTAVAGFYHVLLGTLEARGVVSDAPGLTAGECRGAVRRARPSLSPTVDRATNAFERVVYGKRPAVPEDVETLRAAERAVRRP